MSGYVPSGLRPQEVRNIGGVAAVGLLLVGLIAMLVDPSLAFGSPPVIRLGVIAVVCGLATMTLATLPTVTAGETRLVLVFLFVTAAAGGTVLAATFAPVSVAASVLGAAAGCGFGFGVRRLGIPDHSLLVAVWVLFLSVAGVVGLAMGHLLLVEGELAALIVVGMLAVALSLVHGTLLSERADHIGSSGP